MMAKTILVTGASSGFGKATAQRFLDEGWNVLATMRRPDAALFQPQQNLRVLALDVTDRDSIDRAVADGLAAFGRIDVLVNNAGIGVMSAIEFTPDTIIREVFETNLFGMIAMSRAVIPYMRERGEGVIINVTSSMAASPMPLTSIYSSTKWAIEGFSESISHELRHFGVKVRLVQPGLALSTNFGASSQDRTSGLMPSPYDAFAAAYRDNLMRNYPADRTTEEGVAEVILSAATDQGDRLRYPAGADAEMLIDLRRNRTEAEFLTWLRQSFLPVPQVR
ncbi:SDR family oxidoreductase [Niveispirillum sp. BGYR6]|uniref:SDR family oxidoreductase n=1 Tax=Niveispirillum sp. BGYR6 TaxID=2971249 RepID=UPI0022B9BBE4|nr:SDR family oxidoreductase [Niveispirillum sp. BGYR6]MDG5497505.1 SDR family oxidoreductase [Niveispirillum sp. BGYR6]